MRLTKEKLKKLKEEQVSDKDIARQFDIPVTEVIKKRKKWGIHVGNKGQWIKEAKRFTDLIDEEKLRYLRGEPVNHDYW